MKIDDGGPAFPLPDLAQTGAVHEQLSLEFRERGQAGMSLRDYFAAKALAGYLSAFDGSNEIPSDQKLAKWSYAVADAMLEARKQTTNQSRPGPRLDNEGPMTVPAKQ